MTKSPWPSLSFWINVSACLSQYSHALMTKIFIFSGPTWLRTPQIMLWFCLHIFFDSTNSELCGGGKNLSVNERCPRVERSWKPYIPILGCWLCRRSLVMNALNRRRSSDLNEQLSAFCVEFADFEVTINECVEVKKKKISLIIAASDKKNRLLNCRGCSLALSVTEMK